MSASPHFHRIRWYGMPGRIPRTRHMADRDWGWDARCSCGWETRTGGAIAARIREAIADHRFETRPDVIEAVEARMRETLGPGYPSTGVAD